MKDWQFGAAAVAWLSFVQGVAGNAAMVFSGISAILVCLVAFYEAGKAK